MLRFPDLGSKADPRLKNMSYLLAELLAISLFALLLGGFSLCNTRKAMQKEREDAIADSVEGAYKYSRLQNRLKATENELHPANKELRDVDSDMDKERRELRDTIQDLHDRYNVDQEEIRSLKQHVSNTECDCDEHFRWLGYASRANRKLAQENQDLTRAKENLTKENRKLKYEKQKLQRENQQLETSLTEKDRTTNDLQAQVNDTAPETVAAAPSSPIYIPPNDQTEPLQQMQRDGCVRDLEQHNQTLSSEPEGLQTSPVDEGERQWPEGGYPDERSSMVSRDEAIALDVLRHEVDLREARDGKKAVYAIPATSAFSAPKSTPGIPRTHGLQQSALVAGRKRDRAEYSDGEVDDEEGDDRKKVKMMDLMVSRDI